MFPLVISARSVLLVLALSGVLLMSGGILSPSVVRAVASERVVVNPSTGLAISGFDPVAYFTAGKPEPGHPDLGLSQGGTVWRFQNAGNRAAFSAHPEVYTPSFGGYDSVAIAQGKSVPGHPLIWAIAGERLYLFYSVKTRTDFLANPGAIIERAMRKWPAVVRSIGR